MWRVVAAVALLAAACTPVDEAPAGQHTSTDAPRGAVASQSATPAPRSLEPDREPETLLRHPEEQVVVDAITSAGFRVERIGISKFEVYPFADPVTGRVFGRNYGDKPFRVDVLFLTRPAGEVRICPRPYHEYSLTIDSRPAYLGATAEVFFGVSDRFFVIASPRELHAALVAHLKLTVPTC